MLLFDHSKDIFTLNLPLHRPKLVQKCMNMPALIDDHQIPRPVNSISCVAKPPQTAGA
jgi:hypothetical protein